MKENMSDKVEVIIGGEVLTLRSENPETPDYIQRLARYADKKISDIREMNPASALDDRLRTLLIAINFADDYHKALDKFQRLDSVHKRFVQEMGKLQDENGKLTDRVKELETMLSAVEKELDETKKAFDQFVENFDEKNTPVAVGGDKIVNINKPRKAV